MTNKIIGVIAVLALVIGGVDAFIAYKSFPAAPTFGAVGVKLAENYDPYIRYNGGYYSLLPISTTGGITNTGTWTQGTNGTAINRVNTGTCYILPYATTIAATTTAQVDCQGTAAIGTTNTGKATALAGVSPGDFAVANLSSTTIGNAFNGLVIDEVVSSSTAGYLTFVITNNTGGTFTWPVNSTASGTASYIVTH